MSVRKVESQRTWPTGNVNDDVDQAGTSGHDRLQRQ
jgi:hypothetical protein